MPDITDSTPRGDSPARESIPIVLSNTPSNLRGPTDDLIHAVLTGDVTRVQYLSMHNLSISAADSWVVYQACLQGLEMIHALGLNPKARLNRVLPWQMGDQTLHFILRTPFYRFLGTKLGVVSYLIQNGGHPLQRDRQGNTALHILAECAMQNNNDGFGIMRVLLDKTERAPISKSVRDTCLSNIDLRNIPLEKGEGCTALMIAVMCNHADAVQTLLEHGASPHVVGPSFQPPLYFAVSKDFVAVARLLLQYGAIINPEIEDKVQSLEMMDIIRQNLLTYEMALGH